MTRSASLVSCDLLHWLDAMASPCDPAKERENQKKKRKSRPSRDKQNGKKGSSPLGLKLGKRLALGVITDDAGIDVAANIQLLGPEHRHLGRRCAGRICLGSFLS